MQGIVKLCKNGKKIFSNLFIVNRTTYLNKCVYVSGSIWLIQKLYRDLTGSDTHVCLWMSLWETGLLL